MSATDKSVHDTTILSYPTERELNESVGLIPRMIAVGIAIRLRRVLLIFSTKKRRHQNRILFGKLISLLLKKHG